MQGVSTEITHTIRITQHETELLIAALQKMEDVNRHTALEREYGQLSVALESIARKGVELARG